MSEPIIGQPLDRCDGPIKVRGRAQYTADLPIMDLAHAVLIQSTIARGRIRCLDTRKALSAPGVIDILTHLNAPELSPSPIGLTGKNILAGSAAQRLLPLQDTTIYYNGQSIGLVVARTLEQATYAASLVQTEYEQESPVLDMQQAWERMFAPAEVWGDPPDTLIGNREAGLDQAEILVDQQYCTTVQHHNALETHTTIAVWEGEELTLYETTTWPDGIRRAISFWLNHPLEKIRVVAHFVGGSFGCKGPAWPHTALAAIAARRVGHPVKLTLTRQQAFTSVGYRPELRHHVQLGATREGRLTLLTHEVTAQTAMFDERVVAPATQLSQRLYACPAISTSYRLVQLNRGGPFTMRGPGDTPGLFALESAMDELACALSLDPVELRLRNYAEVDPANGRPWTSKSLRACYLQGAERFGWKQRDPRPRSMRQNGHLVGWGMASCALDSLLAPASATARFFADGSTLLQSATCDQGTGSYTVMRQIAAETLGVAFQQIRFELGDTRMPLAPISAGSMTAASVGSAVYAAARALRSKILALALGDPASPLYGQSEEQIATENGHCFLKEEPRKGETYREILKRQKLTSVEVTERSLPDPERRKYSAYAFGAHFVEVHVHPDFGTIRVGRYVGAFSAGRILNPKTASSQLIGGITWGIGMALMEQTLFDPGTGRIINANLGDYHVPVHADVPAIEAFFVDEYDPFVNGPGVKGIGELGVIGSAAAIANAVHHATGKRIRDLPITLDKLL